MGTWREEPRFSSCKNCPKGFYQNEIKQLSCKDCPEGYYQKVAKQSICEHCPSNWYQSERAKETDTCKKCEKGRDQPEDGQKSCKSCELGKFNHEEAKSCKNCPLGFYMDEIGSWGTFWTENTYENSDGVMVENKLPGTDIFGKDVFYPYNDGGLNIIIKFACKPCAKGMYVGTTGSSTCTKCEPGRFSKRDLSEHNNRENNGHRNWDLVTATNQYGVNTPGARLGIRDYSNGVLKMHHMNDANKWKRKAEYMGLSPVIYGPWVRCEICKQGTFQSESGQDSCQNCVVGMYADQIRSKICKVCAPGTYQNNANQIKSLPCGSGKYQDEFTAASSCKLCPVGRYTSSTGLKSAQECTACPVGRYQNEEGKSTTCKACSSTENGMYADEEGLAACKLCEKGTYEKRNGRQTCEYICPTGTYASSKGKKLRDHCFDCPSDTLAGLVNKFGCTNSDCSHCPGCKKGFYAYTHPSTGEKACKFCTAGKYNPNEGQVNESPSCKKCGVGQYHNLNAQTDETSCAACAPGTYTDEEGKSNCKSCPTGKFAKVSKKSSCDECPLGFYQHVAKRFACRSCPRGRYSNENGLAHVERCQYCPKGWESPTGSTDVQNCTEIFNHPCLGQRWTTKMSQPIFGRPRALVVTDFDGDGYPDVVTGGFGVEVYHNDVAWTTTAPERDGYNLIELDGNGYLEGKKFMANQGSTNPNQRITSTSNPFFPWEPYMWWADRSIVFKHNNRYLDVDEVGAVRHLREAARFSSHDRKHAEILFYPNTGREANQSIFGKQAFVLLEESSCDNETGLSSIYEIALCNEAANELGLQDKLSTDDYLHTSDKIFPTGCYHLTIPLNANSLKLNRPRNGKRNEGPCSEKYQCLCAVSGGRAVVNGNVSGLWSLIAADLDQDGRIDLLSASEFDNKISWYRNTINATGSFGMQKVISSTMSGARSVCTADFNGDGRLDVAAASYDDDKVSWFPNLADDAGAVSFPEERVVTSSADGAMVVVAADLNGDGYPDLVCASGMDASVRWYQHSADYANVAFAERRVYGQGVAGWSSTYGGIMNTMSLVAEDLDGDGHIDLVWSMTGKDTSAWDKPSFTSSFMYKSDHPKIQWWRNSDGLGTFPEVYQKICLKDNLYPVRLVVADVDGDGDKDILVSVNFTLDTYTEYHHFSSSFNTKNIRMFNNTDGRGFFHQFQTAADMPTNDLVLAYDFAAVDMDLDGDLDVVSTHNDGIRVYDHDCICPAGQVRTPVTSSTWKCTDVPAGRYSSNGFASVGCPVGTVAKPNGTSGQLSAKDTCVTCPAGLTNTWTGAMNASSACQRVCKQRWTDPYDVDLDTGPVHSIAVADINGDGHSDVVIIEGSSSIDGQRLVWYDYPANSSGAGQRHEIDWKSLLVRKKYIRSLVVADVDSDGDFDILFASYHNNKDSVGASIYAQYSSLVVLANDGQGNFRRGQVLATRNGYSGDKKMKEHYRTRPYSLDVADINGDGHLDVAFTSYNYATPKEGSNFNDNRHLVGWFENKGGKFGDVADDTAIFAESHTTVKFWSGEITLINHQPDKLIAKDFNGDGATDILLRQSYKLNYHEVLLFLKQGSSWRERSISGRHSSTVTVNTKPGTVCGLSDAFSWSSPMNQRYVLIQLITDSTTHWKVKNYLGVESDKAMSSLYLPYLPRLNQPKAMASADFNKDGHWDVVVLIVSATYSTNENGNTIHANSFKHEAVNKIVWYENPGDDVSQWRQHVLAWSKNEFKYPPGNYLWEHGPAIKDDTNYLKKQLILRCPQDLAVFDADGDDDFDVIVVSSSYYTKENTVAYFENVDGLGTFHPVPHILSTSLDGVSVVTARDLDGDLDMDLVVGSNKNTRQLQIHMNKCLCTIDGDDSGNEECSMCQRGTAYSKKQEEDVGVCTICEAGKYNDRMGSIGWFCSGCPSGFALGDQATNALYHDHSDDCVMCPPGTEFTKSEKDCQVCVEGHYQNTTMRNATCTPCAGGEYLPLPPLKLNPTKYAPIRNGAKDRSWEVLSQGHVDKDQCLVCATGLASEPGSGACITCPSGWRSVKDHTNKICEKCLKGTYSSADGKRCTQCPKGYSSSADAAVLCDICSPGTEANEVGTANCKDCSPGLFALSGSENCSTCPLGYFAALKSATACSMCFPGQMANSTSMSACYDCSAGMFALGGKSTCSSCPFGYQQNEPKSMFCNKCQNGQFSKILGAQICQPCQAGSFTNSAGQVSCMSCLPGQSQNRNNSATCVSCIPGRYSAEKGAVNCDLCAKGKYVVSTEATTCKNCAKGKYQSDTGQAFCFDCVPGKYQQDVAQSKCDNCHKGRFAIVGRDACQLCPRGYYQNEEEASNCLACMPGLYSVIEGSVLCSKCQKNFYGSESSATECLKCPRGRTAAKVGSVQCTDCVSGTQPSDFSPLDGGDASATPTSSCETCAVGLYSNSTNSLCRPCEIGKFTAQKGVKSCTLCELGKFVNNIKATECNVCQSGMYQNQAGKTSCKKCPIGWGSILEGNNPTNGLRCADESTTVRQIGPPTCVKMTAIDGSTLNISFMPPGDLSGLPNTTGSVRTVYVVRISSDKNFDPGMTKYIATNHEQVPVSNTSFALNCEGNDDADQFERRYTHTIHLSKNEQLLWYQVQYIQVRLALQDRVTKEIQRDSNTGDVVGGEWSPLTEPWRVADDCPVYYLNVYKSKTAGENIHNASGRTLLTNALQWSCNKCPVGACCTGERLYDDIIPMQGYWQVPNPTPNMSEFMTCPFPHNCIGSRKTECNDACMLGDSNPRCDKFMVDPTCSINKNISTNSSMSSMSSKNSKYKPCICGTTGVLCAICEEGWTRRGSNCIECEASTFGSGVVILCFIFVVAVFAVWCLNQLVKRLPRKYRALKKDIFRICLILLNFAQIGASLPGVFQIEWPVSFLKHLSSISPWSNFDVLEITGAMCQTTVNHRDKLGGMVLVPVFLALGTMLQYFYKKKLFQKKVQRMSADPSAREKFVEMWKETVGHAFDIIDTDASDGLEASELRGLLQLFDDKFRRLKRKDQYTKVHNLIATWSGTASHSQPSKKVTREQFIKGMEEHSQTAGMSNQLQLINQIREEVDSLRSAANKAEADDNMKAEKQARLHLKKKKSELKRLVVMSESNTGGHVGRSKTELLRMRNLLLWTGNKRSMAATLGAIMELFFAVHAPVSRVAFEWFNCQPVGQREYMRADYSIECYDLAWEKTKPMAIMLIALFTVGVPLVLVTYMIWHRKRLWSVAILAQIGALYDRFSPGAEWWGLHEVVRKTVLTGLLIFVPSISSRIAIAALISCLALINLNFFRPFQNPVVFWVSEAAFMATTTKYVAGLLLMSASRSADAVVGIVLVCMDVAVFVTVGFGILLCGFWINQVREQLVAPDGSNSHTLAGQRVRRSTELELSGALPRSKTGRGGIFKILPMIKNEKIASQVMDESQTSREMHAAATLKKSKLAKSRLSDRIQRRKSQIETAGLGELNAYEEIKSVENWEKFESGASKFGASDANVGGDIRSSYTPRYHQAHAGVE